MVLHFSKMHGLGNDFIVFDGIHQKIKLSEYEIRKLADRHFGVGCDQLLVVESARQPNVDFRYRIYNADGGEVEQCGNGARCFARFVKEKQLTDKNRIVVETTAGKIELMINEDNQVTVNMGLPALAPEDIPFEAGQQQVRYPLSFDNREIDIAAVSIGNPHAVLKVKDVAQAQVADWGAKIESHPRFPKRVNVGFMQVMNSHAIKLRVFERGVGETKACGTGACAAVVAGCLWGDLGRQVEVSLSGGDLTIAWQGKGYPVEMTGPAEFVFEGKITV